MRCSGLVGLALVVASCGDALSSQGVTVQVASSAPSISQDGSAELTLTIHNGTSAAVLGTVFDCPLYRLPDLAGSWVGPQSVVCTTLQRTVFRIEPGKVYRQRVRWTAAGNSPFDMPAVLAPGRYVARMDATVAGIRYVATDTIEITGPRP